MKIKVYSHLIDFPGTEYIANELFDLMIQSELINHSEIYVHCHYEYDRFEWLRNKLKVYDNVTFLYPKVQPMEFEIPTLKNIKDDCDNMNEDCFVLYIHHKGASQPNDGPVTDWRNLLAYFNITRWKDCVEKLNEGYETVGANWRTWPYVHYSGNFWWAKSSYIKRLPKLTYPSQNNFVSQFNFGIDSWAYGYRHDAEFWIGLGEPKHYSFHNSDGKMNQIYFNHYQYRYPESIYKAA